MLRLFTTFYGDSHADRAAEYLTCLTRNLSCSAFGEVCVLAESGADSLPADRKLVVRSMQRRPNYDDFFQWINSVTTNEDVAVIANTDIWFDNSIAVLSHTLGRRECFALGRWDDDQLFERNDSQDAWAFCGRIENVRGNFPIGVARCDNRMIHELERSGYRVMNPAFSLRAHHVHAGERIEYSSANLESFVDPPYGYVWPQNLWSLPRTFVHNIRHPDQRIGWRIDGRKIRSTLPVRAVLKLARAFERAPVRT